MHAEIHITRSETVLNHVRQFIYPFVLALSDATNKVDPSASKKDDMNDLISVDMSFN